MNQDKLLKIQAYVDNELDLGSRQEVTRWIESDPEARAFAEEIRRTKELIAGNELGVAVGETREFYWSKIERRIQQGAPVAEAAAKPEPVLALLRRWLVPAGALAGLALAFWVLTSALSSDRPDLAASFQEIETAVEEASGMSYHSPELGLTVVWIDSSPE